ncbi:hypothetical protein QUW15_11350 [Desulfovibrio piger]|nr:hypothetical protein [Desulfovibrio piger]
MTTEFPLDIFPTQLFPDTALQQIRLDAASLTIAASNSEWGFTEDETLFYGPGEMIFQYEGAATLQWRNLHETRWHESGPELLPRLAALEFIRRQPDESWLFQFSSRRQGFVATLLLHRVTRIDWTGDADEELIQMERPPASDKPAA